MAHYYNEWKDDEEQRKKAKEKAREEANKGK